jgi:hypothetical protein
MVIIEYVVIKYNMTLDAIVRNLRQYYYFSNRYSYRKVSVDDYLGNCIRARQQYSKYNVHKIIETLNKIENHYSIKRESKKYKNYVTAMLDCCYEHIDHKHLKMLLGSFINNYDRTYLIAIMNSAMMYANNCDDKCRSHLKQIGLIENDDINQYLKSAHFGIKHCKSMDNIILYITQSCDKTDSHITKKGFLNLYDCLLTYEKRYTRQHVCNMIHKIIERVPNNIVFDEELFSRIKFHTDGKKCIVSDDILDMYNMNLNRDFYMNNKYCLPNKTLIRLMQYHDSEYDINEDLYYWTYLPAGATSPFLEYIFVKNKDNIDVIMHLISMGFITFNTFIAYIKYVENNDEKHTKVLDIANSTRFIESVLTMKRQPVDMYMSYYRYFLKNKYNITDDTYTCILDTKIWNRINTTVYKSDKFINSNILRKFVVYSTHDNVSVPNNMILTAVDSLSEIDRNIVLYDMVQSVSSRSSTIQLMTHQFLKNNIQLTEEFVHMLLCVKPIVLIELFHITSKYNYCFEYITYESILQCVHVISNYMFYHVIKPYNKDKNYSLCMFDTEKYIFDGKDNNYLTFDIIKESKKTYDLITNHVDSNRRTALHNYLVASVE